MVARDVVGSANHYFVGDYKPVRPFTAQAAPQAALADVGGTVLSTLARASCDPFADIGCGLFDGNVTASVSATAPLAGSGGAILGTAYHYDQLYRLRHAKTFLDPDVTANAWPRSSAPSDPTLWESNLTYDGNGNIRTLSRHANDGSPSGSWMDRLTYHYPAMTTGQLTSNRLSHVEDTVLAAAFPSDLDTQSSGNYTYDLNGRLTSDAASGLDAITWNAGSRVKSVTRPNDTHEFVYDGLGNRVVKVVRETGSGVTRYEYFVRDEKGEILATYKWDLGGGGASPFPTIDTHTLLSASRLGVASAVPPETGLVPQPAPPPGATPLRRYTRLRGEKQYELTNYLGHVQATIRDRKTPVEVNNAVTHYEAVSVNASEYFPFGDQMPGRSQQTAAYRFGFSGLERDDELKGAGNSYYTNARLYDPRLGRWLSPDPIQFADSSSYVGFSNSPLRYSDPRGTADNDAVLQSATSTWSLKGQMQPFALVNQGAWERAKQIYYRATLPDLGTLGPPESQTPPPFPPGTPLGQQLDNLPIPGFISAAVSGDPKELGAAQLDAFLFTFGPVVDPLPAGPSIPRVPRAKWRKGTLRTLWDEGQVGPTGGRKCSTCSKEVHVAPGEGNRDWDVDHVTHWADRAAAAEAVKDWPGSKPLTRKEQIGAYQEDVRIRCPACNRADNAPPDIRGQASKPLTPTTVVPLLPRDESKKKDE